MSMMPKTSVSPAASRNSINPSWRPFSSCSASMEQGKVPLVHLALGSVDVLEVAEHLADRLVGDATAGIPVDLAKVIVLDREVVLVETELAARGVELGRTQC